MGSLNDENAKFVKALSTEEIMALILGVSDQLLTYQIGYGDAIERLRPMLPGACEFGLKSADEILQEKK